MAAIASMRRRSIEAAWLAFAAANLVAMAAWPSWETIPFHFIWISLTLVYGFRVWGVVATNLVTRTVDTAKPIETQVSPTEPAPAQPVAPVNFVISIDGEEHPIQVNNPIVLKLGNRNRTIVLKAPE